MKKALLFIVIIITSCSLKKEINTLKFKVYDDEKKMNCTYKLNVFKNYSLKEIEASGEWKEKQLIYSDGSILYINNERGTPTINYENITNDSISSIKRLINMNDPLNLFGKDKHGKYWKNINMNNINIGYLNVKSSKKDEFEKVLSTIVKN